MSADPSISDLEQFDEVDLALGRVVVPVPNLNKVHTDKKPRFDYAEHSFIGDSIKLTLTDGSQAVASDHKFTFPNGLSLTYGQVNALAGDFYGTCDPISEGGNDQDRSTRFMAAYGTLVNVSPRQPKEANKILAVLQAEVDAVNKALANHEDPSKAYSTLPTVTLKLQKITLGRPDHIPSYLGLAKINLDHFGECARTAYNTGHATAIQKAINGDLEGAYTLNAFADHFLQDSFSAGHLRTPRKDLHKSGKYDFWADLCAKYMHDEDCAIGLRVSNPAGKSWDCFGDKRALDKVAAENLKYCVAAVQASADEIYTAYSTKKAPPSSEYEAWKIAPTLESARSTNQQLAPLFTFQRERRKSIKERRAWEFKTNWGFKSTVIECKASGRWKYPITIDRIHAIIPWSGTSAVSPKPRTLQVFYQMPDGSIVQTKHLHDEWAAVHDQPIIQAVPFSPIAAVTWDEGSEIRVYYLDHDYIVQEHCYSAGSWVVGNIGQSKAKAHHNSRIGAVRLGDGAIRIYYQDESGVIRELCSSRDWQPREPCVTDALEGTSIAVAAYHAFDPQGKIETQIRVYYQTEDLSIKEHWYSNGWWSEGEFVSGTAPPGRTPIGVIAHSPTQIQVYWCNTDGDIVFREYRRSWGPSIKVLGGVGAGCQFTVAEWTIGRNVRIYYQDTEGVLREHTSNNCGKIWHPGMLRVGGPIEEV